MIPVLKLPTSIRQYLFCLWQHSKFLELFWIEIWNGRKRNGEKSYNTFKNRKITLSMYYLYHLKSTFKITFVANLLLCSKIFFQINWMNSNQSTSIPMCPENISFLLSIIFSQQTHCHLPKTPITTSSDEKINTSVYFKIIHKWSKAQS